MERPKVSWLGGVLVTRSLLEWTKGGRPISVFRFNPLIPPPGTSPQTWLKKLIGVIAHAYLLGDGEYRPRLRSERRMRRHAGRGG